MSLVMLEAAGRRSSPTIWRLLARPYAAAGGSTIETRLAERMGSLLPEEKVEVKETEKKPETRWQRLRRERREAPAPTRRATYTFDKTQEYSLREALAHVRQSSWAKFDESLELAFRLNVDPRRADHNLRGTLHVPHGTGRADRIAVITGQDNDAVAQQAREAGAHLVGSDELIDRIRAEKGKSIKKFGVCLAVPEMLSTIAQKIGRILGPRGLMPNAKLGTVVKNDVDAVVKLFLRGAVRYRVEKAGNMLMNVGKLSFSDEELIENIYTVTRTVLSLKPADVRRNYMRSAKICSSMGPSTVLNRDVLVKDMLIWEKAVADEST